MDEFVNLLLYLYVIYYICKDKYTSHLINLSHVRLKYSLF